MENTELLKWVLILWLIIFLIWEITEKVVIGGKYPIGTFKALYRFLGVNLLAFFICLDGGLLFAGIFFTVLNLICLGCIIAKNQSVIYNQLVRNALKEIEKEAEKEAENVIAEEK